VETEAHMKLFQPGKNEGALIRINLYRKKGGGAVERGGGGFCCHLTKKKGMWKEEKSPNHDRRRRKRCRGSQRTPTTSSRTVGGGKTLLGCTSSKGIWESFQRKCDKGTNRGKRLNPVAGEESGRKFRLLTVRLFERTGGRPSRKSPGSIGIVGESPPKPKEKVIEI